jgi:hypothetical protein
LGAFPQGVVEAWYSRGIFPHISSIAAVVSDSVPFSWLDLSLGLAPIVAAVVIRRRRFAQLTTIVALGYLFFFWGWGLNYHRTQLVAKLSVNSSSADPSVMKRFGEQAAREINNLYHIKSLQVYDDDEIRAEVVNRVRRVVWRVDSTDWRAPSRVKRSLLANPWFRIAGVDGIFNPFGHEPIMHGGLLEIEQPFVMAHELAHVRGYPDEGDANLIAVLATVVSDNPHLRYSGWLQLWFYLRTPDLDGLLEEGPRRDLRQILERIRSEQVRWVSRLQAFVLDWYLRANNVQEGIRSYARVAVLAAGTQEIWNQFR